MSLIKYINSSYSIIISDDKELKTKIINELSPFAENYRFHPAFRARTWDGRIRLYKIDLEKNIIIPTGFIKRFSEKYNLQIENFPEYEKISEEDFKSFLKTLNLPFEPRDYQLKAAYETIINGSQINIMATSSGKSLTIYLIIRYMLSKNKKTVLIVPNVMLVNQIYSDFKSYGFNDIDNYTHLIMSGKIKHFKKPLTISTWQSLQNSKELFHEIDCFIGDEIHTAAGSEESVFKSLIEFSKNAQYKIGFTGTLPSSHIGKLYLEGAIGKSINYVNTKKLIELGLATPVEVKVLYLNYPEEICKEISKMDYQKEVSFLCEYFPRLNFLSKLALKLSKNGNTLALFQKVEKHGLELLKNTIKILTNKNSTYFFTITKKILLEAIEKNIEEIFMNDIPDFEKINRLLKKEIKEEEIINLYKRFRSLSDLGIYFISGEVDGEQREKIRKIIETKENVIVFASYATMSTGVNIKNLKHLIFCESTKSDIRLLQSIGRMLRKHENKSVTKIWDIVDDCTFKNRKNYVLKHFNERLNNYIDQEFDISETSLKIS